MAGRSEPGSGIDLTRPEGLEELRRHTDGHDVVVNASGIEEPRIVETLGPAALVEISATAAYLAELSERTPAGTGVLLGAGLVPGLSTILVRALPTEPGDDVDLAVVLGSGEEHGAQAVAWTASLAGRTLHDPPEGTAIRNYREFRRLPSPTGRRRHLRADFPDHFLVGRPDGISVRTYLATGGAVTTAALAAVGWVPAAAGLIRYAPHWGDARWSLTALSRRTGVSISAQGEGQSVATGRLTAAAAIALHEAGPGRVVTMSDVLDREAAGAVPGIEVG
ncbi:hypothetical protein AAFP30_13965 [Gordonia sp. CPCC 205515]|uniref:hypothetical protein n=1 Tax=Gordonia sp. CPCC 205515 TaxID=3140791 RepID=UPI003AF35FEA